MQETSNTGVQKKFDLEDRTTDFAKEVIRLCRELAKDPINNRLVGQVVGSSGSIGANYREANDSLGKKDFEHKVKIARKEAKETIHWLDLLLEANPQHEKKLKVLKIECVELRNILSAIIKKFNKFIFYIFVSCYLCLVSSKFFLKLLKIFKKNLKVIHTCFVCTIVCDTQ